MPGHVVLTNVSVYRKDRDVNVENKINHYQGLGPRLCLLVIISPEAASRENLSRLQRDPSLKMAPEASDTIQR